MKVAIMAMATLLIAALPVEIVGQFDCRDEIANLTPCYGYIEGRDFYPATDCCNHLEIVIQTRSDCLCEVLRGGNGGGVNQTRFLELPNACGVQTPSLGNCNNYGGGAPPYFSEGAPPYFSDRPPYGQNYHPYYSGYSTKILNSLLVYAMTVASCARVFII